MANGVDREKREARLRAVGLTGRLPDRLTERVVEAVQKRPTGERYMLSDGRGLALAVYPDGAASWVLQTRTLAGKPKRCGLGSAKDTTLEAARTRAEELRAVIRAGGDPVAEKRAARREALAAEASTVRRFLLDTYAPTVLAHRKDTEGTKARILASWKSLLDTPLSQLSAEVIEKVLADRKALTKADGSRLLANATLNRDWATFRSMLEYARRKGYLSALPVVGRPEVLHGLGEEPRRRYLGMNDSDEMRLFLEALGAFKSDEPGGGDFLRCAAALALNTGLRRGELVQLRDDMLKLRDLGNERIELPGAICKSGKGRDLYLNPDAIGALKRWIEVRKTLKVESLRGELFPGKAQCWEDRISQREFPRLCEKAGIVDLVFHDLRRSFASLHVQGGTPLMEVQKMLGHASITTTEKHYAYLAPSATRTAARAFRVS